MTGPGLTDALAAWLPRQRWYGGRGTTTAGVDVERVVELADDLDRGGVRAVLLVVRAHLSTGESHLYQVPLAVRATMPSGVDGDPIARRDGLVLYDATSDPEAMALLLGVIARGGDRAGVESTADDPDELRAAVRAGAPVRRLRGEQSNTSVVFGDRVIVKLFRRLATGTNPDLEVHRALRPYGLPHVAALLGSVATTLDGEPVTLALAQRFVPGAVDGWKLATAAARAPAGQDPRPEDDLRELGIVLAEVHHALGRAFGTSALTGPLLADARDTMLTRLDGAVVAAPVLEPYADEVRGTFAELTGIPPGEHVQRVHGDLHLGQVLRTADGWKVIDFEGEPSAPIARRVVADSPLRDVAGMLRSLDYAAAQVELSCGSYGEVVAARRWAERAKTAFLAGYGAATGTDLADRAELLRAWELDKAVYEVVYETRHRPGWAQIPLRAVAGATAARGGGGRGFHDAR
ncbi:MAG: phosphotransferase [Umezawaea sp.]